MSNSSQKEKKKKKRLNVYLYASHVNNALGTLSLWWLSIFRSLYIYISLFFKDFGFILWFLLSQPFSDIFRSLFFFIFFFLLLLLYVIFS